MPIFSVEIYKLLILATVVVEAIMAVVMGVEVMAVEVGRTMAASNTPPKNLKKCGDSVVPQVNVRMLTQAGTATKTTMRKLSVLYVLPEIF